MAGNSKDISPVGWYVGSYMLRFIELDGASSNEDPDGEFLAWENTIIVRANDLDEAYSKVVAVAQAGTDPYKGGPEGVPVRWVFEGVTDLLPIYEPLEDGAEIMWAEHKGVKLSELRQRAKPLSAFKEHLDADSRT
jgi:hypothetical protein